jgi:transposase
LIIAKQKYDNEFKVMIVELLKFGIKTRQISDECGIEINMINRWRREYESKMGDFSKRRELSIEERELKALKKELRDVKIERDILKKAASIFSKSDN